MLFMYRNALLCDHWRNRCVEAGREGVIREFSVNFLGADQPMYFTNQAGGIIHAYLGINRGVVKGEPTVDRYIMEFDLETKTFTPLFETQHTGSSGSYITLDSYSDSEGNLGLFFNVQPLPRKVYHISRSGLEFIKEIMESGPTTFSLEDLMSKKIDGNPIIVEVGKNLQIDTWGIGARMTEDGIPYVDISSSGGYLHLFGLP